jgi:hypothetical protein
MRYEHSKAYDRAVVAARLREAGRTYIEIGVEFGVSPGRAAQIVKCGMVNLKRQSESDLWCSEIPTAISLCLRNEGFRTKESVANAIKNGRIALSGKSQESTTVSGLGPKRLKILCSLLGIPFPALNPVI